MLTFPFQGHLQPMLENEVTHTYITWIFKLETFFKFKLGFSFFYRCDCKLPTLTPNFSTYVSTS